LSALTTVAPLGVAHLLGGVVLLGSLCPATTESLKVKTRFWFSQNGGGGGNDVVPCLQASPQRSLLAMCMICSFLLAVCMFVPSSSLLFRARPALVLSGGVVVRRVHSSGTSAPSMLSLLMVPVNHMPGGVSTASAIPLQGFLPFDGVGWWYVELGGAVSVTISFKGGLRIR